MIEAEGQNEPSFRDIDPEKVNAVIGALRPGHTLSFKLPRSTDDPETYEVSGGCNSHIIVDFDDGQQWLVKIPRFSKAPTPRSIIEQVMSSEFTTYQALFDHGYPVAKVHGWGIGDLSRTNSE